MKLLLVQIVIVAFALFAALSAGRRYFKKELRAGPLLAWLFLWLAIVVAVIAPQTTELLARVLGVGRGADVVIYLSIVALFYLMFRVLVRLEKMDRAITAAIRAAALRGLDPERDSEQTENQPGAHSRE